MHQSMPKVLVLKSKKVTVKVSYKIYSGLEPELDRSRNSDLRLRGAGAARNNFGSATMGTRKDFDQGWFFLCLKCFRLLAGWLKVPGPGACGAWLTLVFAFLRHGSHIPLPPLPRTKLKFFGLKSFLCTYILHRLSYIQA